MSGNLKTAGKLYTGSRTGKFICFVLMVSMVFTMCLTTTTVKAASEITLEDFNDVSDWNAYTYNASISAGGGIGTISCGSSATYGNISKTVTYNVDTYPALKINIDSVSSGANWGKFAVKANDGGADITLHGDNENSGKIVYNLKAATGWSGQKNFQIKIFATGGSGKTVKVDYVKAARIVRNPMPASVTVEDFTGISDWDRFRYNANMSTDENVATITCGSGAGYGTVSKAVSCDVDAYPYIKINATQVDGGTGAKWAMKVNDGSGDITLQAETDSTGVLTYNLKSITGWNGQKNFDIRLFPVGGNGRYLKADYINLSQNP